MSSKLQIFELLDVLDNLKHLKRTGWVKCGVPEPETVACHMYRMAVLAMALEGEIDNLDAMRTAIDTIASYVPNVGDEWTMLWKEYEEAASLTARVVKHLDKFDMIVQADKYEQTHAIDLQQFFTSTTGVLTMEPFATWDRELREKRNQRINKE